MVRLASDLHAAKKRRNTYGAVEARVTVLLHPHLRVVDRMIMIRSIIFHHVKALVRSSDLKVN